MTDELGRVPDAPGGMFGDPDTFLSRARERIDAFHRGPDVSGSRITRLYSAAVDNTLRGLHARAVHNETVDPEWASKGFCLVATGGYARRALCPWSDVDLLLITEEPSEDSLAALSDKLLYPLWNDHLRVGRREGTIEQIIEASKDDLTLQMCLLDLRYIAGSRPLYNRLLEAAREAIDGFRESILEQAHALNFARFERYGDSVFLLEPHVKEGKGGLRDFHWLGWLTRLRFGLRGDYDLLLSAYVEPDHYRELIEAYEFLLRVRIQLHSLAGKARDRLQFEAQEPVARALGFQKRGGLRGVERFMGAYYRHAYAMAHWCGLYVTRSLGLHWDEAPGGVPRRETLMLGPSAPVARRVDGERLSSDGSFVDRGGTIEAVDPEVFTDPKQILALFTFMQRDGGRLHHDLIEQVRQASKGRVGARFRKDTAAGATFRALLEGRDVFRVLASMHRTGFLGRYIPEFGATFCQAQHNRAHLYTVDVHCLYVVRELERLGDGVEDGPAAGAYIAAETRGPLLLAGLLHDIAKSHGAAHSRVGAEMVPSILGRLGYAQACIERTRWLVRYHLVLSDTAYHRDLQDASTHTSLRAVIGNRERLDDLMALTWADSRATNLAGFTSWRQALLSDAYRTAVSVIDPDEDVEPERRAQVLERVEALLAGEVGRRRAPEVLARLVEGAAADRPFYFETTPAETLATHAVLLDRLAGGETFPAHARLLPSGGAAEWTVAAQDRQGLLASLSGSLTAAGLSIVGAETHTRVDGTAVDTFHLVDGRGKAVEPSRLARAERALGRVQRGEADLEELVQRAMKSAAPVVAAGAVEHQRVDVSNEVSDTATVVEVVVQDRAGLVWEITRELSRFGCDVRVAKIATRMDLASDTFYVIDSTGKPLSKELAEQLAARLHMKFLPAWTSRR